MILTPNEVTTGGPNEHRMRRPSTCTLGPRIAILLVLVVVQLSCTVGAQDLLRRQHPSSQASQRAGNQDNQNVLSSLANIQLPPQLAALTPQQLHQLAQLRELQLQQEAAGKQQDASAPAPIGVEPQPHPTAQPASGSSNNQIPQPTTANRATSPAGANAERHDDSGAYNESGSELEGVTLASGEAETDSNSDQANGSGSEPAAATGTSSAAAPTFEVNWNKCPQLEPSESEKTKKTQVITKCLQSAPIPTNLTRENVEAHREQIATCALRVEGWFDESGGYKYEKAESEIRGKKLDGPIEIQVLKFHVACKEEANKKFPKDQNKLIDQVQFYQACMDYYISIVCEIEVSVDQ